MTAITTHVLDVARGRPAEGVSIVLSRKELDGWHELGHGVTDPDGRLRSLMPNDATLVLGTYKLVFDTESYFTRLGIEPFFPWATVVFIVRDAAAHHHVPLLLSPFAYSTYRGS